MNLKSILAAIGGGLTAFITGWLLYGILLTNYMRDNMIPYAGLMRSTPEFWALVISNLSLGFLFIWLFVRMNIRTFYSGFKKGSFISFLMFLAIDIQMYAIMSIYKNFSSLLVDVLASTLVGALACGVGAFILGTEKKAE